ncbi:hypothetical protein ACOI1C_20170 [Bacillus sp. DJP31]|uniref:hypothetical protein n=1 Tax=Bacillus sp. DJP31 TaxID=3409789 RepID=UPI003BB51DD1
MPITDGTFNGLFMFDDVNSSTNTKLNHDRYDVYVNGDFVGHKSLLTESEEISDVNDFLHAQGYQNFQANVDGDHYEIQTDDEGDMRQALQIYLQSR